MHTMHANEFALTRTLIRPLLAPRPTELAIPNLIFYPSFPSTPSSVSYAVEGVTSKTWQQAKAWLYKYPEESHTLLQQIADLTTK